jgi:uncharacterized 2Fe-2S/4Fe-4S cluster protein (DUF4445 family)
VAALLADLDSGEVKEITTACNRQVSCGHDVISRINYARDPERLDEDPFADYGNKPVITNS